MSGCTNDDDEGSDAFVCAIMPCCVSCQMGIRVGKRKCEGLLSVICVNAVDEERRRIG
jgi:hypothetical protein